LPRYGKLNDHFRELWKQAGYDTDYGSAAVIPPPPPTVLRAYYICPAEYAISNIVFARQKVSRFSELNDPFELLAFYRGGEHPVILKHREQQEAETGLLCFSSDWTNPVLWSHYGARHRGICLGFDIDRSLRPRQVKYQPKRLEAKLNNPVVDAELADLLLCTKFESWSYEREWRVPVNLASTHHEAGLCFYRLDPKIRLSEVILGPLCTLPWTEVRDLANARHGNVSTIRSRLALNSFNVVPDEETVLTRALP
jgi:Protein of unknown function (DUF2971)